MSRKFTFFPLATISMVLAFTILIGLGSWQLQRRTWKLELISAVSTRANATPAPLENIVIDHQNGKDVRYTVVTIKGRYDHNNEVHVFGTIGPTPGYFIFTPLQTTEQFFRQPIYINRGFVPQANKAITTRMDGQVEEIITVTGLFRYAEKRKGIAKLFTPNDFPKENQWYTRDPDRFTRHYFGSSEPGHNWYVDSFGKENTASLPRGDTTRIDFNNKHLEYALTWFGLAITLVGVWLAYSFRKKI